MFKQLTEEIKNLPRFEGSHCPDSANHEYIVRNDEGKYIRIEDVLGIIENISGGLAQTGRASGY